MPDKEMKKRISQYCRAVKRYCPLAFKKRLIGALKNDIGEYIENNPQVSFDDIEKRFGQPKQFALEYIAAMDDETRMKAIKTAKYIKIAVIVAIISCLIVAGCAIWITTENSTTPQVYYYSEEIIEE